MWRRMGRSAESISARVITLWLTFAAATAACLWAGDTSMPTARWFFQSPTFSSLLIACRRLDKANACPGHSSRSCAQFSSLHAPAMCNAEQPCAELQKLGGAQPFRALCPWVGYQLMLILSRQGQLNCPQCALCRIKSTRRGTTLLLQDLLLRVTLTQSFPCQHVSTEGFAVIC